MVHRCGRHSAGDVCLERSPCSARIESTGSVTHVCVVTAGLVSHLNAQVFDRCGLGRNATYLPKWIHPKYCKGSPQTDLNHAYEECKMCIVGAAEGRPRLHAF